MAGSGRERVVAVRAADLPGGLGDVVAQLGDGPLALELHGCDDAVDVGLVDALARLALLARRRGTGLELHAPAPTLRHLAELLGLCEALGLAAAAGSGQVHGEAEPAEDLPAELLEEVVDVPDAAV